MEYSLLLKPSCPDFDEEFRHQQMICCTQILDDCMERVYAEAQQQWKEEAERSRQAAERERQAAEQRRAAKAAQAEADRAAAAAAADKQRREAAQAKAQKAAAAAVRAHDSSHQKQHPMGQNPDGPQSADVPDAPEQTAAPAAATDVPPNPGLSAGGKRRSTLR